MSQKILQKCIALITLALLISSTPVALAQSGQDAGGTIFLPLVTQSNNSAEITDNVSAAEQEAALAFWTHERLATADAMPLMVQAGPPTEIDAAALAETEAMGPAGYSAPVRAAPNADQIASAAYANDWAVAEVSAEDEAALEASFAAEAANQPDGISEIEGTSQIYTSSIANWLSTLQTQPPHRWIGRFTFTTPTGNSFCAATAISGNNIVTAAHCVYDTPSRNQFYTNKAFTPAYRNGSAPYGTFATTVCQVLPNWVSLSGSYAIDSWARYDIAVCTVGRNSAGQTLNNAVGGAGKAWNYGYVRHVFNLGYASQDYNQATLSWAGAYLRLCSAETFQRATDTRGMGCNWGRGMSGGPWIDHSSLASTSYGTNGYWPGRSTGFVTSVNSGIFFGTQNSYAGRFTSNNIVVLCNSRGC